MASSIETQFCSFDMHQMPQIGEDGSVKSTSLETKVSSYFVLPDSSVLRFSMEGNTSIDGPILVFINDALTSLQIWDPAFALFQERHPQYRLLRYDIRGYSADSLGTSDSITLALLVSDLKCLLETLSISHVHSVVGLGFGANIGLALLAAQPSIASSFVGVGFAVPDSPVRPRQKAMDDWNLRSSLARRVGMGITADKAVSRWFTADARGSAEWVRIRHMVAAGNIGGMEKLSNAVLESVGHDTDESEQKGRNMLESLGVPSLFLCGAGDGILPEEMETYPGIMRKEEGTFTLVARANRLVCCERTNEFVNVLHSWLDVIP